MPNAVDARKIQKENWSALIGHINKNKNKIAPNLNLGTLYAGKTNGIDLKSEIERILPIGKKNRAFDGGIEEFELVPVWKSIERANERSIAESGSLEYDTLAEVIKDLGAPKLHDPSDGTKMSFRHLYECVDLVVTDKLNPPMILKENQKRLWTKLSTIYASNCKGAVTVIEGVLENYADLDADRDMIRTELETAMKNNGIDAADNKKIIDLVEKYFDKIPSSNSKLRKDLEKAKKELAKKQDIGS